MLAAVALFASLGAWQLDRAAEKDLRLERFASGGDELVDLPDDATPVPRYQHVRATGRYESGRQFLLDNMTHDGQPGYRVLTPLIRDGGAVVIVDRGFVAGSGDRSRLPGIAVDAAPRVVTGRADFLPRPGIELAADPGTGWPRVVGFPHIEDIGAALGREVHPQVILLDPQDDDGYQRDWQPPGIGPERHLGYAVQWFGFAVTAFVIWVLLSLRKREMPA